jgi:hypothetical protein
MLPRSDPTELNGKTIAGVEVYSNLVLFKTTDGLTAGVSLVTTTLRLQVAGPPIGGVTPVRVYPGQVKYDGRFPPD